MPALDCRVMAFADSKPVFKDRTVAAGISEEVFEKLSDAKLDTLSKFALQAHMCLDQETTRNL